MNIKDRIPKFILRIVGQEAEPVTTEEYKKRFVATIVDPSAFSEDLRPLSIELQSEEQNVKGENVTSGRVLVYWEDADQKVVDIKYETFQKAATVFDKLRKEISDLGESTASAIKGEDPEALESIKEEVSKFIRSLSLLKPASKQPIDKKASKMIGGVGVIDLESKKITFSPEFIMNMVDDVKSEEVNRKPEEIFSTEGKKHFGKDNYVVHYWYPENIVRIERIGANFKVTGSVKNLDNYYHICSTLSPRPENFGFIWDSKLQDYVEDMSSSRSDVECIEKKAYFFDYEELKDKESFKKRIKEDLDISYGRGGKGEDWYSETQEVIASHTGPIRNQILENIDKLPDSIFPLVQEGQTEMDMSEETEVPTFWLETSDAFNMAEEGDMSGIDMVLNGLLKWTERIGRSFKEKESSTKVSYEEQNKWIEEKIAEINKESAKKYKGFEIWTGKDGYLVTQEGQTEVLFESKKIEDVYVWIDEFVEIHPEEPLEKEEMEKESLVEKKAGTWSLPETKDQVKKLKEILTYLQGEGEINTDELESDLYNVMGDDSTFDKIDQSSRWEKADKKGNRFITKSVAKDYIIDRIEQILEETELATYKELQPLVKNYRKDTKVSEKVPEKESLVEKESDKGRIGLIDFSDIDIEGEYIFGADTEEYEIMEDLNEREWEEYINDMAAKGITVEYNSVEDWYEVKGGIGIEEKESSVEKESEEDFVDILDEFEAYCKREHFNLDDVDELIEFLDKEYSDLDEKTRRQVFHEFERRFGEMEKESISMKAIDAEWAKMSEEERKRALRETGSNMRDWKEETLSGMDSPSQIDVLVDWINTNRIKKTKAEVSANLEKHARLSKEEWYEVDEVVRSGESKKADEEMYWDEMFVEIRQKLESLKDEGYIRMDAVESVIEDMGEKVMDEIDLVADDVFGKQDSKKQAQEPEAPAIAPEVKEEVPPTKLKELKIKPKLLEMPAVPEQASPEMSNAYDNIRTSQRKLEEISKMVADVQRRFLEEKKNIEEKGGKLEAENIVQSQIDKLAKLIENSKDQIVDMSEYYATLVDKVEKGTFKPSTAWKLEKVLTKFPDAVGYLEKAIAGAQSLAEPERIRELTIWPKKTEENKDIIVEASPDFLGLLDDMIEAMEGFVDQAADITKSFARV